MSHEKCHECGEKLGSQPAECEVCWHFAMEDERQKDEWARDREIDKRIDEARGK